MLPVNKRMQDFLAKNGIPNTRVMYIDKGSQKGVWRIGRKIGGKWDEWTQELADKFNKLGFTNAWGKPVDMYSGNGGMFQAFLRGHNELLKESKQIKLANFLD